MAVIERVTDSGRLHEVAELADKIWHECFTGIISNAQIDYMVGKFQSYEAMQEQVNEQRYSYFAVSDGDDLCGYFAVKPESDDRFFLSKLYLRLDKRGQGTASQMLGRVFEEARRLGKRSVYLTVNKHNSHAIAVYTKTGFKVIGEPVTDIGNGFVMDDYVMEYKL